ncbi:hypothetical protein PUNSTDRAFT_129027 [Punctularia strigosozonata HHB-11173 SS5]|uniref:uncharacterized protein n=1 Tax=Punctularia strigosozonata (strain HHB-11173) TaxID=741275 RepID=UPI000441694F|nr:uncharacterized protein PUNSTDRAFT_129027 [Punctularia strigosozonata HHB-11173 SS5]EIN13339.1 hypothetical protein PUNSTDRAFT_129027 [Punctularia strigosozonata HHB-11173 SS5]
MTSKLWNLIDLRKPKLALALCKRFPKTELRVTYVSRNLADFETLERIILRYPSRISVLHVKGIKPKIDTFMSQFQTCAPALTILHLTRDTTVPWDAAHQNSFFECLTGVDCSKLRYLCMRGFSSHSLWISRWLRSLELRDLEISQMHESDDEPLDDVLDALEALPFLERLCLSRGGSYELLTAPSVRSSRKVHLCRLRELDLAGPTRSCASLLKHLKIADSAKLEVKCWSECSAYFADIWQETQPYCLGPVVALDMHISDVSLCSTGRARRGGPTLVLALDGASPEEGDSILQQLGSCQLLSSNATIFALNKREGTLRPRSLSSLQNILANAEGLQHLSLKGLGAAEYAFRALHNLHAAGDGSHIALPNLATLRIIDAEHSSGQLWFGLCCAELIRRHAFALRHGKAPLQNVKIAHCSGLDRTALGLLEELATKVVVDPSPDDDDSDTSDNVSIRSDYADGDMEQSD